MFSDNFESLFDQASKRGRLEGYKFMLESLKDSLDLKTIESKLSKVYDAAETDMVAHIYLKSKIAAIRESIGSVLKILNDGKHTNESVEKSTSYLEAVFKSYKGEINANKREGD